MLWIQFYSALFCENRAHSVFTAMRHSRHESLRQVYILVDPDRRSPEPVVVHVKYVFRWSRTSFGITRTQLISPRPCSRSECVSGVCLPSTRSKMRRRTSGMRESEYVRRPVHDCSICECTQNSPLILASSCSPASNELGGVRET